MRVMTNAFTDSRYQLTCLLGNGGMARVYLAHDAVLVRDVALKVLREQYADDKEFVERFRREARSAASLSHPHIVQIYDRGRSADGSYYMTMEYLPGGTLKRRILQEGALPSHEAAGLALQIAGALGLAHERGVIHRDVKPQNILLTTVGNAKVGDFGIARASSATALSGTSMILGTAGYMSPEQAMGEPVGPASDLYSLGVVLYEMLTGVLPYEAETPIGLALKHVNEPPRPPRETNPNVPEGLNVVTAKLLAKYPEDRYANAGELIQDLQRIRAGLPPLATLPEVQETTVLSRPPRRAAVPPPSVHGKSRRKVAGPVAVVLASVGLLGGIALAVLNDLPMLEQARQITGLGEENSEVESLAMNPAEAEPVEEEPTEEEPAEEEPAEEKTAEEEPEAGSQTRESSKAEDEATASSPPPAVQSNSQSTPAAPPVETVPTPVAVAATEPVAVASEVSEATPAPATSSPAPKPQKENSQPVPAKAQEAPKQAAPETTLDPSRKEKSDEDKDSGAGDKDPGPVDFGPDGPVDFGSDGPVDSKKSKKSKKD